jgi:serine protease Do
VGTYVRSVTPESAAYKAGIAIGDIIIALDDTEVDSMDSLRFALRRYRAGDTASLTVWRTGNEIVLTITFDEDLTAGQPQRPQPPPQPEPDIEAPPRRFPIP